MKYDSFGIKKNHVQLKSEFCYPLSKYYLLPKAFPDSPNRMISPFLENPMPLIFIPCGTYYILS